MIFLLQLITQQIDEVKHRRNKFRNSTRDNGEASQTQFRAPNEVPLDLILTRLKDEKYINAYTNPEVFPLDTNKGKKQYYSKGIVQSNRMKDVLLDPNVNKQELAEYRNKMKYKRKEQLIPYEMLKQYEEKLEKAYDKKELNNRMRGISADNFFKYKDFHGAKPDLITESPTKYKPSLKEVFEQKFAGFESELTRKIKSKKLESPFEWKIETKTPERPFRDRFKFGTNKISGKITIPAEENAFLEMTSFFEKKNKDMGIRTFYPNNTKGSSLFKSLSSPNLQNVPKYAKNHMSMSKSF